MGYREQHKLHSWALGGYLVTRKGEPTNFHYRNSTVTIPFSSPHLSDPPLTPLLRNPAGLPLLRIRRIAHISCDKDPDDHDITKQEINQTPRHGNNRRDEILHGRERGSEEVEDGGEDALDGGEDGGEQRGEGVDHACHFFFFMACLRAYS